MFEFRGQRNNGEWVVGHYVAIRDSQYDHYNHYIYTGNGMAIDDYKDGFVDERFAVKPETLSVSFGKLDSTGTEIFASFPIDGVMTEGGDVVSWFGGKGKPIVFEDSCFWFGDKESDDIPMFSLPSPEITIIDKGGGNDE